MDHCYSKQKQQQKERIPSVFGTTDHSYNKICDNTSRTPTNNRKRERSTPTGKTPQQPSKIGTAVLSGQKRNTPWTDPEKEYFIQYVKHTPRSETLTDYWQKCASAMNAKFPSGMRNGHACKSLAQRLYIIPSTRLSTSDSETVTVPGCCLLPSTVDVSTQTTLTLPVNTDWAEDCKSGDWVFIEPKKQLQENASIAADVLNKTALKRLRHYPNMTPKEKAGLIDLLCTGTSRQVARAIMSSSLANEINTLIIYDTEMDARECSTKGSTLRSKQYQSLGNFNWTDIINELVVKQSFLAEVLLAVALPSGKIGNTKATEGLVPVIGTVYGMLMKQRFHELSAIQKVISISLANEQAHQKMLEFQFGTLLFCYEVHFTTNFSNSATWCVIESPRNVRDHVSNLQQLQYRTNRAC
ncbi:uncharacterized protein LOC123532719 [Mercenaria mercenaria]|uniref:uncharacterized protein LOC123532719 n=1 Tax=Mercenaria mercenaria TaxID=6596 RepID=UPI00234E9839|nr:uncharacterized protein LOC123532719 [Mercenaria mercenaria]